MERERESLRKFILAKFPIAKSKGLEDSSRLLEEGILDSLGVLELVTYLQEDHGIPIDDEELVPENFASIDAISAFMEAKRASKGAR
ncbi:MAG TPA: phosphopantetheine-binding protein [Vicinamibacteria bacterium]|nr:phosphopantetheine-binding protein [Vicinamibacteria bacterium]